MHTRLNRKLKKQKNLKTEFNVSETKGGIKSFQIWLEIVSKDMKNCD